MQNETLAMIVISVCSLMVNGPGFNSHSVPSILNFQYGISLYHKLPIGYAINWAMRVDIEIDGARIENNILSPEPAIAKKVPMTHTLMVS